MYIIENVKISGLWGHKTIEFKCDKNFNFLIGENGTGKTTVINLIAAVLMVDFDRLDKIAFNEVIIHLKREKERRRPSIRVIKKPKEEIPFHDIEYQIKESQGSKEKTYDLDHYESERLFRKVSRLFYDKRYGSEHIEVKQEISKYLNINWLSVHRNIEKISIDNEEIYRPAIDIKLELLNNELVKYFSKLSKKYSDEVLEFQKKTLLSVLTSEKENSLLAFSDDLDIERERKLLGDIFSTLGVEERKYKEKVNLHLDKFNKAIEFRKNNNGGMKFEHISSVMNVWRSHSLVSEYEKLQKQNNLIFNSKNKFVETINKLFSDRKKLYISEKNELNIKVNFENNEAKQIPICDLSSGEKQLLIILGQALLQEERPTIFIADEPELSLHLKWQVELTKVISTLNPNAQIIFATHSPDIVAEHQEKVIRMENML